MTAPRWQDAHGPTWNGLAPGQSWAIPANGPWQARLDRCYRTHAIGRTLAEHPTYGAMYEGMDFGPWSVFEGAIALCRERNQGMIAAKRNAAQAGQGGE